VRARRARAGRVPRSRPTVGGDLLARARLQRRPAEHEEEALVLVRRDREVEPSPAASSLRVALRPHVELALQRLAHDVHDLPRSASRGGPAAPAAGARCRDGLCRGGRGLRGAGRRRGRRRAGGLPERVHRDATCGTGSGACSFAGRAEPDRSVGLSRGGRVIRLDGASMMRMPGRRPCRDARTVPCHRASPPPPPRGAVGQGIRPAVRRANGASGPGIRSPSAVTTRVPEPVRAWRSARS
jgi:hypothetical protein